MFLGLIIGFALGTFTWWKFGNRITAAIDRYRSKHP